MFTNRKQCGEVSWHQQLRYVEMRGDGCANRIKFRRPSSVLEETKGDFGERLEQDEQDGM